MEAEAPGSLEPIVFVCQFEDGHPGDSKVGEGLVGQCALDKRRMLITNVPGNTIPTRSECLRRYPTT